MIKTRYGKPITAILLVLSLLLCCVFAPIATGAESALNAEVVPTRGGVYTIATADQLQRLSSLVSAGATMEGITFRLIANIDCNPGVTFSADGTYTGTPSAFSPIGTSSTPFKGTFDGNGYTIRGLYVVSQSGTDVGLFGCIKKATIKNVTLANSYISGTGRVGGICGFANDSSVITGCTNRAYVSGLQIVGGICGEAADYSTISACSNENAVSSTTTAEGGYTATVGVGGICGVVSSDADSTAVQTSYNLSTVSSSGGNVGGIAGYASAPIELCYNAGAVSGAQYVGGICGMQYGKQVQNVYNLESVGGTDYVGGIVGYADAYVMYAYSIGEISAQSNGGDICGASNGTDSVYALADLKKTNRLPAGFESSIWEIQSTDAEYSYPTLIGMVNPNLESDADGALLHPITLGSQNDSTPLPASQSASVKVEYRAALTPTTVYSVDVVWGSMAFVYTEGSAGTWNPATHSYDGQTSASWTCTEGANVITIINHSNTALTANLSYQAQPGYTSVQGSFNTASLPLASAVGTSLGNAPTATGALTLQGELSGTSNGEIIVGKVSVDFE